MTLTGSGEARIVEADFDHYYFETVQTQMPTSQSAKLLIHDFAVFKIFPSHRLTLAGVFPQYDVVFHP